MSAVISKNDFMLGLVDLGASPEILKYVSSYATDEVLAEAQKAQEDAENIKQTLAESSPKLIFDHKQSDIHKAIGMTYDSFTTSAKLGEKFNKFMKAKIENSKVVTKLVEDLKQKLRDGGGREEIMALLNPSYIFDLKSELAEELDILSPSMEIEMADDFMKQMGITSYEQLLVYFASENKFMGSFLSVLGEILKDNL